MVGMFIATVFYSEPGFDHQDVCGARMPRIALLVDYFAAADSVAAGGAAIIAANASSAPPDSALASAYARRRARSSMFFCARVRMILPPFSVESAVIIDETMTPMT